MSRGGWNRGIIGARIDPVVRFWAKVQKSDGCWPWTASVNVAGYGLFNPGGRSSSVLAHRWAWEQANGSIPTGLFICHHCDTPACVRPDHLFLGTARDNTHDMLRKGRSRGRFSGVTHCLRGHPLSGKNLKLRKGARRCRICVNRERQEHWDRTHPNAVKRGPRSKLTEEAVRAIRSRPGELVRVLAEEFGCHPTTISHVRHGATWRHVR